MRNKTANDSATPAGNGTMAGVLAQLFYLTGKESYRERAETLVCAFSGGLQRNFYPLSTLINGAETLQHALQIVIVGERDAADSAALLQVVDRLCLPDRVLQVVPPDSDGVPSLPEGHPAAGKGQADAGRATAYVCRGPVCSLPITDAAELERALAS